MSVKVGVRVRPFNVRENERESECIIEMPGQNQTKIKDEQGREKTFTFDHSFWSHDGYKLTESGYLEPEEEKYADQKKVFDCVGRQIMDNAWEGYHCCLFAYGQTGSGKSYSMVGYGANKGIIPISCEEIFRRIEENQEKDKTYEVSVSMLEIYNEKVQDLLINPELRPPSGLKIRESKVLGIFVEGITKYPVTSYKEIDKKMDEGYRNRTIGSTLMNATSTRAHTIVIIEFRQILMMGKRKSEKLSMINLVDLAGSERLGSTGAQGDRLKEGCNINKSLLVLGNVINCLADKALGKKKDVLPPYRDSALTRILQNALGGNSKTVMICALSPASINYEETLSTLRYADRAKKIQNKAVINESEHDKMVRLLKEENQSLKSMIEDLAKKLQIQGGTSGEEDKEAFLSLKEEFEANQRAMKDMEKTFEEKLEEAKKNEHEQIGQNVDINLPHLVVLHEDPQLSHKLKYPLVDLPVHVGKKNGVPLPDIVLSGLGIMPNHAVFLKEEDKILLKASDLGALKYIFVNGKNITEKGQVLHSKDRIVFGTSTIAIFMRKSKGDDIYKVDWEFAQTELQKEIEKESKIELENNEKRKKEEMDLFKKNLEEEYIKKKQEMDEQLKKKMEEYEEQLKQIKEKEERDKIEQQRIAQEMLIKEKMDQLEEEKAKKKRELKIRETAEMNKIQQAKKDRELLHHSEKLENSLKIILKKIRKMKIIMDEFNRNVNLDAVLQKSPEPSGPDTQEIMIRVENYEDGTVYYWNTDTFHNRYDLLQEQFNKYNEDENFDVNKICKEDDPLWDEASEVLLGSAYYSLEPMGYLMGNESTLTIISSRAEVMGELDIDIIPHDETGNEYDEVPETPQELIGQSLNYKVCIKKVRNLKDNFCRNLCVEYNNFYENSLNRTQKFNLKDQEKQVNIDINEEFEHKIDFLTKDVIEQIDKGKMEFRVYAYEEVEKKGRKIVEEDDSNSALKSKDDILKEPTEEMPKIINDYLQQPGVGKINIPVNRPNPKVNAPQGKKKDDCILF